MNTDVASSVFQKQRPYLSSSNSSVARSLFVAFILAVAPLDAADLRLTLKDAESAALASSPTLAAARFEAQAASRQETSQRSYLFPTLALDGSYRWVDEVPSMQIAPGRALQFGDHRSNTVGIGASWQIWDWGAAMQAWKSVQAQTESRRQALRAAKRQTLLAARLSYFQVQAAAEQSRLIADTLKLSQAQYRDIQTRYKAGTASRADALAAHQEVLSWSRQLRAARGDLAASLRDLHAAMGIEPTADLSLPMDTLTSKDPPRDVAPPSVSVDLDPIPESLAVLVALSTPPPDASLPQPAQLDALAQGSRRQAKAQKALMLPKVQVTARASYDYPNGPVLETIQQNMVGVSASMPLFDWGRTLSQSRAASDQALAFEKRRDQAVSDLKRDWLKAQDQLRSLEDQRALNQQSVAETMELAGLAYDSYKNGRIGFTEVQSANLRALQAAVMAARTDVQVLVQRALVAALSKED
jgi:outer membrane protein TolC